MEAPIEVMSDPVLAAELEAVAGGDDGVAARTVDHHLRNIFHRLGIRSRTELACALH
ncbi:hypothetical protein FHU28_003125 [Micromonospora echinospora]|uniref:HTH luxR-type domain-containing protein n=1 Tax=Micromonospora echinospora TaxID=1877 RepID=A0ABR6MF95_MICEC|nr:LuxR C-terminal-related transcriptional regulator [Micromonospora echinospora]MBB5113286.1 hypothetical protein [Micromonospora echinospora]